MKVDVYLKNQNKNQKHLFYFYCRNTLRRNEFLLNYRDVFKVESSVNLQYMYEYITRKISIPKF